MEIVYVPSAKHKYNSFYIYSLNEVGFNIAINGRVKKKNIDAVWIVISEVLFQNRYFETVISKF